MPSTAMLLRSRMSAPGPRADFRSRLRIQPIDATPRLSSREEDVAHEAQDEDPVHRSRQGFDVGTLATGRVAAHHRSPLRSLPHFDWRDALENRRDSAAAPMSLYAGVGFD